MAIDQQLQQEQIQKLALTPELVQAISILQLNSVELQSYIENELLSNPLLEIAEKMEDYKIYDKLSHRLSSYEAKNDDEYVPEVSEPKSMRDSLYEQLSFVSDLTGYDFDIGSYIIESLDNTGYLYDSIDRISSDIHVPAEHVSRMLKIVQGFDPAGIAARNLGECLALQLKRLNQYDSCMELILSEHLENVAENKITCIAKACNISPKKAQQYCDEIKKLNPKPGSIFSHIADTTFIFPDCTLEITDGEFVVTVNSGDVPRLCISPYYCQLKSEAKDDRVTLDYIEERLNAAKYLIKGIEKRQRAIQVVAKAIVERQADFFVKGKSGLRPLTLADVAYSTGLHISTISRTIRGKYIETPRGLYELKYFFSGSAATDTGKNISTDIVKDYVKNIVDEEDKSSPLSDERIKDIIQERYKITIARRTVAKYREQLEIPGALKRKRY